MPADTGHLPSGVHPTDSQMTLIHNPTYEIDEALGRKKKQLESEIADFKADKEQEYKRYEMVVRERLEARSNGQDAGQEDSSDEHKHDADDSKPKVKGAKAAKKQEVHRVSDSANKQSDTPSSPGPSTTSSSDSKTLREDREKELRGIFTPSFLPLLEDSSKSSHRSHRKPSPISGSHHRSRHSLPSPLSFSLTLPATTYDPLNSPSEPEATQPSSAPRPSILDRRSSSKSDTSPGASLRSSLRQPKSPEQLPRERKHVLFSIDNVVMSPSSSPIAHRSKTTSPDSESHGTSDDSIGKARKLKLDKSEPQLDFTPVPIKLPLAGSPTSPSLIKSYHTLIEPIVTTPPEELEQADLMPTRAEDDPLFAFDEETAPPLANDEDFEDISEPDVESEDIDAAAAGIGPVVDVPPVGSLPIEIKYPSRPR